LNVTVDRASLKDYFLESENTPFVPQNALEAHLFEDSFLLPSVRLLSVIFDTVGVKECLAK